uniref:Ribosome biogenesis protein NSA1 n=1 Tax=Blastobotrys adeninivorans TaxID=409370 RepID=A0A060SZP9_BLAAD
MKIIAAAEDSGSIHALSMCSSGAKGSRKPIVFGAEGRSCYIQKMILVTVDGNDYIIVARKGGVVQMYDAWAYELVKEWKPVSKAFMSTVVGLQYSQGKLYVCNVSGRVVVRDLQAPDSEFGYWQTSISDPVSCFRVHPTDPGVAVAGGKDNDVEVVRLLPADATNSSTGSGQSHAPVEDELHGSSDASTPSSSGSSSLDEPAEESLTLWLSQHYRGGGGYSIDPLMNRSTVALDDFSDRTSRARRLYGRLGLSGRRQPVCRIWKAKNSHCPLGEPTAVAPIWVSDARFYDIENTAQGTYKLAVCTRFGELRLYNTRAHRRPIVTIEVSHHPLTALWHGLNSTSGAEILMMDTLSQVYKYNCETASLSLVMCGAHAGGCHVDMSTAEVPLIAMGGLDRHVRVYDFKTGRLMSKFGINSRVSGVAICTHSEDDDDTPDTSNRRGRETDQDDDGPSSKRPRIA